MNQVQSAVNQMFDTIASQLGTLSPFAKAIVPGSLAVVVSVVNGAFAGSFNTASIAIAGTGLVTAIVVYLVPNKPKAPTVPPAPAAAPPAVR